MFAKFEQSAEVRRPKPALELSPGLHRSHSHTVDTSAPDFQVGSDVCLNVCTDRTNEA